MPATPPPTLRVAPLAPDELPQAATVLAAAETAAGGELVDEAERRRLSVAADGRTADAGPAAGRWRPFAAHLGDEAVGYAAVVVPDDDSTVVGDAAVAPWAPEPGKVLQALLSALGAEAGGAELHVWTRRAGDAEVAAAADAGFTVHRRLGVLGRSLPVDDPAPATPDDVTVRASRPGTDDAEVVRVLAAAYEGTDDGGWDLSGFRERTRWDWFRPQDLLVADTGDGTLLGLHWLKRRDATTGEVHNLAVAPQGQGRGLGPVLLRAGLDHLAAVGCTEVVLWVDRANDRAVQLYERAGFTTRYDDVAFVATSTSAP